MIEPRPVQPEIQPHEEPDLTLTDTKVISKSCRNESRKKTECGAETATDRTDRYNSRCTTGHGHSDAISLTICSRTVTCRILVADIGHGSRIARNEALRVRCRCDLGQHHRLVLHQETFDLSGSNVFAADLEHGLDPTLIGASLVQLRERDLRVGGTSLPIHHRRYWGRAPEDRAT